MFFNDLPESNKVFIKADFAPIPNVGHKLVHKDINKERVMALVRRDTRYGIDRRHRRVVEIGKSRKNAISHGLTKAQVAEHVKSLNVAKDLDELISFYQEELIKAEYPNGLPKFDYEKYKNDFYIIK